MFCEKISVKHKNFIKILDSLATGGSKTRSEVKESTSLSQATVVSALEVLLDMGLVREEIKVNISRFRITDDVLFPLLDLTEGDFSACLVDLCGRVKYRSVYRYSDAYFFDENLSIFMRSASAMLKGKQGTAKSLPVAIVRGGDTPLRQTTKGILGSSERLGTLVRGYFGDVSFTLERDVDVAIKGVESVYGNEEFFILKRCGGDIYCTYVNKNGSCHHGVLRCEELSHLGRGGVKPENIAKSLGNLVSVLRPRRIVFDSTIQAAGEGFIGEFGRVLSLFLDGEASLPDLEASSEPLHISGFAKLIRDGYFEEQLSLRLNSGEKHV